MKSYASVDRIEGKFAVCEVELVDIEVSSNISFLEKDTEMVDILIETINSSIGEIQEGDIIVVEYEQGVVTSIYARDDSEKEKRIRFLELIMG